MLWYLRFHALGEHSHHRSIAEGLHRRYRPLYGSLTRGHRPDVDPSAIRPNIRSLVSLLVGGAYVDALLGLFGIGCGAPPRAKLWGADIDASLFWLIFDNSWVLFRTDTFCSCESIGGVIYHLEGAPLISYCVPKVPTWTGMHRQRLTCQRHLSYCTYECRVLSHCYQGLAASGSAALTRGQEDLEPA